MNPVRSLSRASVIICTSLIVVGGISACGGGGGGSSSGSSTSNTSGKVYRVGADVTSDTCGERIAHIDQEFTFLESNGQQVVDTTVNIVPVADADGGLTFSYAEQNGSCVRTYTGLFSNVSDSGANVKLTSQSTCAGVSCKSEWTGTATVGSQQKESETVIPKVSGENCVPPTDELFYRPSAFECNGNAFVGMIDPRFRAAFSVVLRANGFRNDRDPNNPECGLAECSPYKTQKILELPQHQVRCLGGNGYSSVMRRAQRISIKFISTLSESDKQDPLKFEQYCLADTSAYLN